MRLGLATPTRRRPSAAWLASVVESAKYLRAAGHDLVVRIEAGCPYIDAARQKLLTGHLNDRCDAVVFVDDDLSWQPDALVRLIEADEIVAAGDYRFKRTEEEYMSLLARDPDGLPVVRADGCVKAERVPGGFLMVRREAVDCFARAYPELTYAGGHVALFQHGVIDGVWHGEDYAFCRRWTERCGDIWVVPDLDITHHNWPEDGGEAFAGNLHEFLMRQPGGINDPARLAAA